MFLQQSLPDLPSSTYGMPLYDTPLGANFDPSWVKSAKAIRRKEMTQTPVDILLDPREDSAASGRTLELADWESDIVYSSL